MGNTALINFSIKINGQQISEQFPVISIHVTHETNSVPTAQIVVSDTNENAEINFDFFEPGGLIEVGASYDNDQPARLFKGSITKQQVDLGIRISCTITAAEDDAVMGARKLKPGPVMDLVYGQNILAYSSELSASATQTGSRYLRGSVTFQGTALVKPGDMIAIENVGTKLSGNVTVTAVSQAIEDGKWLTTAKFER